MSLIFFSLFFLPAALLIFGAGYFTIKYIIESWKLPAKRQFFLGVLGIFSLFAKNQMPSSMHYYLVRAFVFAAAFALYVGVLIFFLENLGR